MPDENIDCTDLLRALNNLEDYCLNKTARNRNYNVLNSTLSKVGSVDVKIIERILAVCVHDLKEDMKYSAVILNIISAVVQKEKAEAYNPSPNFVPSALAVIKVIKTTVNLNNVEALKVLCYDTLCYYPNATLITVVEEDPLEVLEIFNLYCQNIIPAEIRQQTFNFLSKLLQILPPEKKRVFVETGILVWFSKVIPCAVCQISLANTDYKTCIKIFELLTDDLIQFDYTENIWWQNIMKSICHPEKYPLILKNLLRQGNDSWHRLWIVFIKLLKHQVTQVFGDNGIPINYLLPVVEEAFKLDMPDRSKAFECWNALIDNFSTETSESNINKTLKLLMVPLKCNNAKTEETALIKFNCWWHLIIKFQTKMERFLDTILVPFLNFIFGRHSASTDTALIPGQITINVKRQTIKAIVELLGHVGCDGCTDLPKLKGKIVTTKHLVDNWMHWVYSLTSSITIAADDENMLTKQQITCLWKSFILTIGELPDNNIRKDLFYEMLSLVKHLIQEYKYKRKLGDMAFNVLLMSLFDGDPMINVLLQTKNGENDPINEVLDILRDPSLKDLYQSSTTRELVTKLRHVTNLIVDKHFNHTDVVAQFLIDLPETDIALNLWTALAESVCDNEQMSAENLQNILMWPLKFMNEFSDVKLAAMAWYRLYNLVHLKLDKNVIDDVIMKSLLSYKEYQVSSSLPYFTLCVLLAVLKYKLVDEQFTAWLMEDKLLEILTNNSEKYVGDELLFPVLVDKVVLFLHNVTININEILAGHALVCAMNMLKISSLDLTDESNSNHLLFSLGNILKSVDELFHVESYHKLAALIADDFISIVCNLYKHNSIKLLVSNLLKTIIKLVKSHDETLFNKIKSMDNKILNVCNDSEIIEVNQFENKVNISDNEKFTTPDNIDNNVSVSKLKRSKKKELSIVDTVLENGEQYVVVKSNWKFNPRKLTEHQREKLKRKREDIPALYQDLSQSQDEHQLKSWKMDSQDTSSSKSESKPNATTNKDDTTILKNMTCSNVVPRILENILIKEKNEISAINSSLPQEIPSKNEPVTPKNSKSGMTLKDRVFKNVRILIEKSSLVNKETEDQNSQNVVNTPSSDKIVLESTKTENILKTPKKSKMKLIENIANSAPPLISAERPSRVKKMPKRFDNVELVALRKRRNSLQHFQPESKIVVTTAEIHLVKDKIDKINDDDNNEDTCSIEPAIDTYINQTVLENEVVKKCCINKKEDEHILQEISNAIEENTHNFTEKLDPIKLIEDKSNTQKVEEKKLVDVDVNMENIQEILTPEQLKIKETNKLKSNKSTMKKNIHKKSRLEKELAIDMVEGHPFLKINSKKRTTRKDANTTHINAVQQKGTAEKTNTPKLNNSTPRKTSNKNKNLKSSVVVDETQEHSQILKIPTPEEIHCSDVIESSQESTFSTLSVKSTKQTPKRNLLVSVAKLKQTELDNTHIDTSQSILDLMTYVPNSTISNHDSKDDTEFPLNRTIDEKNSTDSIENMDTEPLNENDLSDDVVVIGDDLPTSVIVSSDETIIGKETQEMAEADTQPVNMESVNTDISHIVFIPNVDDNNTHSTEMTLEMKDLDKNEEQIHNTQNDITVSLSRFDCEESENTEISSPYKDDAQRKQDFLNNTSEISPIKTMSPDRKKKSPSPETSSDYVIIKLTSPVHSNGEPFEKCTSPEFFTDDKVSPDKRDLSPPRQEVTVTNTNSPSSSLSLKKKRPQVRGGRAAHMLELCVPEKFNSFISLDRNEREETKSFSPSNTAARRNLRILYNTVLNDNNDSLIENEDSESFLKLKRLLPAVDSSPSGPILKRKLDEIIDDATISPANKRKRVSFHDPPVSTTISVQKYLEPNGSRSPQNSAQKRLVRVTRQHVPLKSPKKLENAFKLDSALTKTLESFNVVDMNNTADDTQSSSLDETPSVEIVKASELNDTDPICPELLECTDPIDNIATELSSPAMRSLLIKELEGKVETIGDLAKMTELEVNRLCIKAPKVKIVKKVLSDYVSKTTAQIADATVTIDEVIFEKTTNEEVPIVADVEMQTDTKVGNDMEVQTTPVPVTCGYMQTEIVSTSELSVQTDESGEGATSDIIKSCLQKRPDFIQELCNQESLIRQISDKLPFSAITDLLVKKITCSNSDVVLDRILEHQNMDAPAEVHTSRKLSFLQDYACKRFDSKDLILLCSEILKSVYDKPA